MLWLFLVGLLLLLLYFFFYGLLPLWFLVVRIRVKGSVATDVAASVTIRNVHKVQICYLIKPL